MSQHDKTLRIINTLQLLTPGRYRTAADIQQLLEQQGYQIHKRTVERDLQALAASPGIGASIETQQRARPYGWRLSRNARLLLPSLDTDLAATWDLVGHYLEHLLPDAARDKLHPEIASARSHLKKQSKGAWSKKVAFLPRGLLKPAPIKPAVREVIYDALLENRQVEVVYRNRQGEQKQARLHLLGVVHRVAVSYLVTLWGDYSDVRHLAFHRVERAEKLPDKARSLPGFNLQEHIDTGIFDIPSGKKTARCNVHLRFFKGAGEHLLESPLESDQRITRVDDATLDFEAHTIDSEELRWWILGFGECVEVIGPDHLRKAIADKLTAAAGRYR